VYVVDCIVCFLKQVHFDRYIITQPENIEGLEVSTQVYFNGRISSSILAMKSCNHRTP